MKKESCKKNNKGFSLVELIVVVLIIAVIGVALAPQVMKWVDRSRASADINNRANIKSAVQIAVADAQANGVAVTISTPMAVNSTNFPAQAVDPAGVSGKEIKDYIGYVLNGDYPTTAAGGTFMVEISSTGTVTVTGGITEAD